MPLVNNKKPSPAPLFAAAACITWVRHYFVSPNYIFKFHLLAWNHLTDIKFRVGAKYILKYETTRSSLTRTWHFWKRKKIKEKEDRNTMKKRDDTKRNKKPRARAPEKLYHFLSAREIILLQSQKRSSLRYNQARRDTKSVPHIKLHPPR